MANAYELTPVVGIGDSEVIKRDFVVRAAPKSAWDAATVPPEYAAGVCRVLEARDRYVLHNNLLARENPGPRHMYQGPTTKL